MTPVRLEPAAPRSRVKHSTTEPLRSICLGVMSRHVIRVGTSIVQPVNSSGKFRKKPAWQILQKSLKWQMLAFMNKIVLKTCKLKTRYFILQKMILDPITKQNKYLHLHMHVYFHIYMCSIYFEVILIYKSCKQGHKHNLKKQI